MGARWELNLMLHAFKKDLGDADRPSFTDAHTAFYYNKYFKKPFNVQSFGVEKMKGIVELIKDTLSIKEDGMLQTLKAENTPLTDFVKLTEDHRRDRQRRLDAGDETAQLKFTRSAALPPSRPPQGAAPPRIAAQVRSQAPPAQFRSGAQPARPGSYAGASYGAQKRPYPAGVAPPPKRPYYGGNGGYSGSSYVGGGGYRR